MAITYPLSLPASIGMSQITMYAENADAMSESPFTFSQQVFKHPGERWKASVSVAPFNKELSEPWVAFLLSLRGRSGTFLLGDPARKQPLGSALGAKKNMLLYTEKFDNAYWVKTRITAGGNVIAAPDGEVTAESLVEDTSTSTHTMTRSLTYVAGITYTFSIYAKAIGARNLRMDLPSAVFGGTSVGYFDLTNGVVSSVNGVTASISNEGNGWYRCSITKTAAVSTSAALAVYTITGASTVSYTGDGVSGFYLWGAQVEASAVVTSYQAINDAYGPFVNGANQTGTSLVIDGASPSEPAFLKAGDYIQLGTGLSSRLHKVLADVATNDAGQGTIDVWPRIRTAPADNATVYVENTVGLFRLASGVASWQIDEVSTYGITFDCVEVI